MFHSFLTPKVKLDLVDMTFQYQVYHTTFKATKWADFIQQSILNAWALFFKSELKLRVCWPIFLDIEDIIGRVLVVLTWGVHFAAISRGHRIPRNCRFHVLCWLWTQVICNLLIAILSIDCYSVYWLLFCLFEVYGLIDGTVSADWRLRTFCNLHLFLFGSLWVIVWCIPFLMWLFHCNLHIMLFESLEDRLSYQALSLELKYDTNPFKNT